MDELTDELTDDAAVLATVEMLTDASGTPTLKIIGELDIASVEPVRTAFDAVIGDKPARVIVDLSELRFIDSSGLTVLLAAAGQVAEVELRDPSAGIRKIIHLTGLSSVFVLTP